MAEVVGSHLVVVDNRRKLVLVGLAVVHMDRPQGTLLVERILHPSEMVVPAEILLGEVEVRIHPDIEVALEAWVRHPGVDMERSLAVSEVAVADSSPVGVHILDTEEGDLVDTAVVELEAELAVGIVVAVVLAPLLAASAELVAVEVLVGLVEQEALADCLHPQGTLLVERLLLVLALLDRIVGLVNLPSGVF